MSGLVLGIVIFLVILIIVAVGITIYLVGFSDETETPSTTGISVPPGAPTLPPESGVIPGVLPIAAPTTPSAPVVSPVVPPTAPTTQTVATDKAIDAALAEVYGLMPATATGIYGIVRTTAGHCRAIGGAMNGAPADSAMTDCHVIFGKATGGAATAGPLRGFFPAGKCPGVDGSLCQTGSIMMTGRSCRAIGGAFPPGVASASVGDDTWTPCGLDIGLAPTYGLFPRAVCPTGTCRPVRFIANPEQCVAAGGIKGAGSDPAWAECEMNLGPTRR